VTTNQQETGRKSVEPSDWAKRKLEEATRDPMSCLGSWLRDHPGETQDFVDEAKKEIALALDEARREGEIVGAGHRREDDLVLMRQEYVRGALDMRKRAVGVLGRLDGRDYVTLVDVDDVSRAIEKLEPEE
jgi:hypothetical protein